MLVIPAQAGIALPSPSKSDSRLRGNDGPGLIQPLRNQRPHHMLDIGFIFVVMKPRLVQLQ